jgi:hypothetical protein
MTPLRLGGACAVALAIAVPTAVAAPIATTVRIQGGSENLLPETPITVDDSAGATVVVADTTDADTITVPAASATAQLASATGPFGLALGFDIFNFGVPTSFVTRIGGDLMPPSFSPSWRLKVNNALTATGSDGVTLAAGDRVSWSFVADFEARELDLAVSRDKLTQGQTFDVTVRSFDNSGAGVPAAGATVVYGDQSAVADAGGNATLVATGSGVKLVSATRAGEVRSQARAVCAYADDPTACDLPPAPVTPPPPGLLDTVAPGSEVLFPISGRRYRAVRALRGSAGPDRSDIARVNVAIARRVGTLCRFMGPRGGFAAPRSCAERRFLPARSSGGRWLFALPTKLPAGKYRAWSRAVDGAGNAETTGVNAVNAISFTVLPRRAAR